eukprot:gnl/Dysnectes_brevis/7139_a11687_406.p1 GENE.gnl/Dysnectes_brevis/7139_a11687_406~~gnl/Dysnectes_brevis/7139_a11687_406.p1  ORF type:complete len:205 (+),score=14.96 gnl/Dysnectes_brevis/7139_a11687_406:35-649(+)
MKHVSSTKMKSRLEQVYLISATCDCDLQLHTAISSFLLFQKTYRSDEYANDSPKKQLFLLACISICAKMIEGKRKYQNISGLCNMLSIPSRDAAPTIAQMEIEILQRVDWSVQSLIVPLESAISHITDMVTPEHKHGVEDALPLMLAAAHLWGVEHTLNPRESAAAAVVLYADKRDEQLVERLLDGQGSTQAVMSFVECVRCIE